MKKQAGARKTSDKTSYNSHNLERHESRQASKRKTKENEIIINEFSFSNSSINVKVNMLEMFLNDQSTSIHSLSLTKTN